MAEAVATEGQKAAERTAWNERPQAVLRAEDLVKIYGKRRVVNQVSLVVRQGEIVGLLGPNGAGKTTTFYMITGFIRPSAGRIFLDERDITGLPMYRRARLGIGYLSQEPSIFRGLTVEQNLLIGAYRRIDPAEMEEDLERIYELFPVLKERRSQIAKTLSGGEQQMLAIGRALMSRPQLILMDEVSLGLMPKYVDEVFRTIEGLHREGVTLLLVEQNARKALAIADRGYVLETGRVVMEGEAARLASDPRVKKAYLGG